MTLIQNGATPTIVFLMVATADHIAGLTGITPTVNISKNGGAGAASTNAASAVDATNLPGVYKVALTATETNTNGPIAFHATGTGADPSDWIDQIVAFNPADSVRLGLTALPNAAAEAAGGLYTRGAGAGQINQNANGQVDTRWVGGNVTVATNNDKTGYSLSGGVTVSTNNDKTGYALTAGEHTNIATDTQTGLTAQGYTATRAGYLDTLNGLVAAIWVSGSRTLTSVSGVAAGLASAVWDALAASYNAANSMGHLLNGAGGAADPLLNTVPGAYAAGTAGYSLGHIADTVWDATMSVHVTAGSTGAKLNAAGGAAGTGSLTVTIRTTDSGTGAPISGVYVWASLVLNGNPAVASSLSDINGYVTFQLNAATYYVFRSKSGVNFSNPQTIVVS